MDALGTFSDIFFRHEIAGAGSNTLSACIGSCTDVAYSISCIFSLKFYHRSWFLRRPAFKSHRQLKFKAAPGLTREENINLRHAVHCCIPMQQMLDFVMRRVKGAFFFLYRVPYHVEHRSALAFCRHRLASQRHQSKHIWIEYHAPWLGPTFLILRERLGVPLIS